MSFLVICFFSYLVRPDALAAFTFFPAWIWAVVGVIPSLSVGIYQTRAMLVMLLGWTIFITIITEEPRSLMQGFFVSESDWQAIPQGKRLLIVSLNCAGGNIHAAKETLDLHPDIVLLQETPSRLDDLKILANDLFGEEASILLGSDTTIIVGGTIEEIVLPDRSQNQFMVHARVTTRTGIVTHVFSTRLIPPVIDTDLLTASCWRDHYNDRLSRRTQVSKIAEQIATIPTNEAIIVGGDFNVPANDGCLRFLRERLSDTFNRGGIGWGHTATNQIPLFRVDQIWASKHFRPFAVTAIRTKYSDHRMVVCKLEVL